ncbi:MAG TPA: hypothetical protein VN517_16195 [Terriglobales bacterium]|nr:hypothetical protein [Terriglobales bacterium]
MADITEAPIQDEIAESLLGEEVQEQPAEREPAAEQQETQEPEAEQAPQEQAEEQTDDWLPSEQEKVFPDEVLQRYAQRYGLDANRLSDPLIRQLVHDKINSDILIQQQREQEQQAVEPEEQAEEPTLQPQPQQLDRAQYFQQLERAVQERTDPEVAKQFHADFLKSFGVPDAEIAKIPPQQAIQFTQTASKYMLNLMNTFMDDLLGARLSQQIGQVFPGFGDMYERSSHAMAWDNVRNSNPAYASLPAYGTKEFSSTLRAAAAKIPGFDEMQFTDAKGKPLSPQENAARKYSMLAQIASNPNVDPQALQRAAAAGANNARRAAVRRSNGNLGSGQSKASSGQTGSSKFQSNTDIFDDETMALWNKEHGRL